MATAAPELLVHSAIYLGAAVVAVPLFKRLGLGTVLGYLAAGIVIGPFGAGLIGEAANVLRFAEFGVVLLLFIIGLELKPARLWVMRRDIFGLGTCQVLVTGTVLAGLAVAAGLPVGAALVAGYGLALSSTALALQSMKEAGTLNSAYGNRTFSILLLQDMAIVPLLALVAFLSPIGPDSGQGHAVKALAVVGTVVVFIAAGKYLLRPVLRAIATTRATEVYAAAALLLVVGAALAMHAIGLSMALGAFLAGVLLAESEFRHQLEADIEPFRGLLLGLFFIAVGMSIDLGIVAAHWAAVAAAVAALMSIKAAVLYGLARLFGSGVRDAGRIAVALPQGGEFAFVIFSAAAAASVMDAETASLLTAIVTLSMVLTPVVAIVHDRIDRRIAASSGGEPLQGPENVAPGSVIVAGFGRVGQIATQMLNARGIEVIAVDNDPVRIRIAGQYGNKVYYGDGRRADVLRAAGADEARLILICVDDREACNQAIRQVRSAFPNLPILARAFDRNHVLELLDMDVDFFIRDTFESSVVMGKEALRRLGVEPALVDEIEQEFRRRDTDRLCIQKSQGECAGTETVFTPYGDRAPEA